MSGFEVVAGIIAAFFVIGIVVGVIAVSAISAVRGGRDRGNRPSRPDRAGDGAIGWEEPPGPEEDDSPRWPGGVRH